MFVPVQQTRPLRRYLTIAAIAVAPIVIAGWVAPLYALRLLRHEPFDGVNLLLFASLTAWAAAMRFRSDYRTRLMLLATLSLLGPALGRLTSYGSGMSGDNDLAVLLLMLGCLGTAAAVDIVGLRRLHPAWILGALPAAAADLLTYVAKTQL